MWPTILSLSVVLEPLGDQRRVDMGRHLRRGELGERPRKRRFAGNLAAALPSAQPAQRCVGGEALDQRSVGCKREHGFRHEGAGDRMAILRRTTGQSRPHVDETLDADHLKHDDKPLLLVGQRADLLPQHRKKKTLNVVPGV